MIFENIDRIFAGIDAMRVDEFLGFLTDEVHLRFGNAPPATGKAAVREALTAFFSSIQGLRHIVTGKWKEGDTVICRCDVEYTRMDGKVVTVPAVSILECQGQLISDYRIYIDISPVYA